jgi:hypothetical protein
MLDAKCRMEHNHIVFVTIVECSLLYTKVDGSYVTVLVFSITCIICKGLKLDA